MPFKCSIYDNLAEVAKRVRKAGYRTMERFGFVVRQEAQQSIGDEAGPSPAGTPPHTHARAKSAKGKWKKGGKLPGAILYSLDKDPTRVVVGPAKSLIGTVAEAFEHEGDKEFRGQMYPDRSFMGPALEAREGELPGILADKMSEVD